MKLSILLWSAFLALSLYNASFHVTHGQYAWLALDAFCVFWFGRNVVKAVKAPNQ